MPTIIISHRVRDYDAWRPAYDAHAPARAGAGISDVSVHRNADDPNEIVVVVRAEDLERAREFSANPELGELMEQAGVVSEPTIWYLDDV